MCETQQSYLISYSTVHPQLYYPLLVHEVGELGDALARPIAEETAVRLGEGRDADGRAEAVADLERRAALQ